jgi:hypothetical protein
MYHKTIQLSWRSPPPDTLRQPRKVSTTLETQLSLLPHVKSNIEIRHCLGLTTMASTLRVGQALKGMRNTYVVVKQLHSHVWTGGSVHASLPPRIHHTKDHPGARPIPQSY